MNIAAMPGKEGGSASEDGPVSAGKKAVVEGDEQDSKQQEEASSLASQAEEDAPLTRGISRASSAAGETSTAVVEDGEHALSVLELL